MDTARRAVRLWFDPEADYFEDRTPGYFRETADDRVMKKVDVRGVCSGCWCWERARSRASPWRSPLPRETTGAAPNATRER
ncbi:MAG: hypothetical protein M3Q49_06865 [Actinomycetota bacterium]|nr:hypothetical protein [Actinomycetota bacterium]